MMQAEVLTKQRRGTCLGFIHMSICLFRNIDTYVDIYVDKLQI